MLSFVNINSTHYPKITTRLEPHKTSHSKQKNKVANLSKPVIQNKRQLQEFLHTIKKEFLQSIKGLVFRTIVNRLGVVFGHVKGLCAQVKPLIENDPMKGSLWNSTRTREASINYRGF